MARTVRILGISGELCALGAEHEWTVLRLQQEVAALAGIPVREQRLLDGSRELRDRDAKLAEELPGDSACELTLVRRDPEQAQWMEVVSADFAGNRLQRAPQHIREDPEVVLAAMRRRPNAFRFAAPKLQADRDFMLQAVREDKLALQHAPRELLADRELVLEACTHHGCAIQFAARELRADREIALAAARSDAEALRFLSHELWSDKEFIMSVGRGNGEALKIASAGLQGDREVCLVAAASDGHALKFASSKLLADRSFIAEAAKVTKLALKYAAKELQGDLELVRTAVQADGGALCFAPPAARADRSIALDAVRTCAEAVAWAARELWTADFFLEAVQRNPQALLLCPPQLKEHRRWLLAAARATEEALRFASPELQGDPSFVLEVLECGFKDALRHASPVLLGSPDFILAAARKSDSALRFATEELRADLALVRAVVGKSGRALQYAAPPLRADAGVALAALAADPAAAEFVAAELCADRAFVAEAVGECGVPLDFASEELRSDPELIAAASRSATRGAGAAAPETAGGGREADAEAPTAGEQRPAPKAAAFPRRLRPPAGVAEGDALGGERLEVPGLPPGPADRGGRDGVEDSALLSEPNGLRTGVGSGDSENRFRLLPWCLPAASGAGGHRPAIRSGLLSKALKMQTERSKAKQEAEQPEEPEQQEALPCGPLGGLDDVKLGDHLRVLGSPSEVLGACRGAGLDFADGEEAWAASAGKYVKVLALDPMDGSIECRVPGLGDIWLSYSALAREAPEPPLKNMAEVRVGCSLQVLRDTGAVLEACVAADLGSIEDEASWEASAGKVVEVIGRDPKDRTVECHVPEVGDVWFALSALTSAPDWGSPLEPQ